MVSTPELANMARAMKEIANHLQDQNRILKTINQNLVSMYGRKQFSQSLQQASTEFEPSLRNDRTMYGWNAAAEAQLRGTLKIGDIKRESDDSVWAWTGEIWERIELPSDRID